MTDKEKERDRIRKAFKARIGEMLKDTRLTYAEIGQAVGRTEQRIIQVRQELGLPRRVGGYHTKPKRIANAKVAQKMMAEFGADPEVQARADEINQAPDICDLSSWLTKIVESVRE
jgi:hypothetical protein